MKPSLTTRSCLAILGLIATLGSYAQQPLELVTRAEMQASANAPQPFEPKALPVKDAPQIEILAPDVTNAVPSPTAIDVKFSSPSSAKIRTDSFRVQYGALKLDVTKRLLGVANVTPEGVNVKQAALPKGKHTLYVSIEDDAGRQTTQRVDFVVN